MSTQRNMNRSIHNRSSQSGGGGGGVDNASAPRSGGSLGVPVPAAAMNPPSQAGSPGSLVGNDETEALIAPSAPSSGGIGIGSTSSKGGGGVARTVTIPLGIEPGGRNANSPDDDDIDVTGKNRRSAARRLEAFRLCVGAGGIYASFLYYGSLQEDVFNHVSSEDQGSDPVRFKQAWFLLTMEALANVLVGFLGRNLVGGIPDIPQTQFVISGAAQVCAKACTSLALANGLSFPVAILAKSGKMAPVMIGSLILGGARYRPKQYLQVLAIILGTALVGMGKSKKIVGKTPPSTTTLGLIFIVGSLVMDGVVGGVQKRLKSNMDRIKVKPLPYDFMYYTNLYMMIVAAICASCLGEFSSGLSYVESNPDILPLMIKFSVCSAVGQSFIFYTIAHFDPLVCSTVTTTRKILSVLISVLFKGHALSVRGWSGMALASAGILSELADRYSSSPPSPPGGGRGGPLLPGKGGGGGGGNVSGGSDLVVSPSSSSSPSAASSSAAASSSLSRAMPLPPGGVTRR